METWQIYHSQECVKTVPHCSQGFHCWFWPICFLWQDINEMVRTERPDWQNVMLYVTAIYKYFETWTLIIWQIHGIQPIWATRWKSYWNANPHFTENWQHLSPLKLQWHYLGLPQIASATKHGNNCLKARTCCHRAWNNPSY